MYIVQLIINIIINKILYYYFKLLGLENWRKFLQTKNVLISIFM